MAAARSVSSAPQDFYSTLRRAAEEIGRRLTKRTTIYQHMVPRIFQEPYIYSGYRPIGKSCAYYLRSFFMLHNESMNVWTHFFGAFIIIREAYRFYEDFNSQAPIDTTLLLSFSVCSIILHFVSTIAHLMHNYSEDCHINIFNFDNTAVGLSAAAFNVISFANSALPAHYEACKEWYLLTTILGAFSLTAGVSFPLAKYRRVYNWKIQLIRILPLLAFYLWGCSPFIFKVYRFLCGDEDIDFQLHHVWPPLLFMIGTLFYSSCFPERLIPYQFDIFGHSHQIFHVCVSMCHVSAIRAVRIDIEGNHRYRASLRKEHFAIEDLVAAFTAIGALGLILLTVLSLRFGSVLRRSKVKR